MHAGPGAKRVVTDHRIIHGNRHADRFGDEAAVLRQLANIPFVRAQQLQVDDEEIHFGVPDALPHAERGGMDAIHAGLDRRKTVDQPHPAVTMTVPVYLDGLSLHDFLLDESYQCLYAVRRRVPHRISEADAPRPARDRRAVQLLERLRPGAGCVFRDVHDR